MNFLKRLFKKNNMAGLYLSLLDYNIIFPNADFYNTKTNQILYKIYNNKYKEILSNRCKSSIDLKLDNIDLNMYVNIISKLVIELHSISDILNQSEDRNNINLNIIINKLNYYKSILSEYKDKSFIKIKVLDNILKRKILFHSKRSIIESEISNLKGKILICQNNILGIEKELNYYYSFSSDNIPKVDNEKEYLSNIYNMDYRFASMLKLNATYKNSISLSDICAIEILLEEYTYKNRESLEDLEEEYNNLLNSNIRRNVKLKKVNGLIDKYMFINRFYKAEDNIFLNKLLELKFNTIEEDYINNGESFIDKYSYKQEIEYFETKMLNKITQIFKNNYKKITRSYRDYYVNVMHGIMFSELSRFYKVFIKIFRDTITTKDNMYDIKEILKSPLYTGLIFSIDNPIKLKAYFRNFEVKREECKDINFYDEIFEWYDKVPVDTIARLIYENYLDLGIKRQSYDKYPIKINKQLHYLFLLHYLFIGVYCTPKAFDIDTEYLIDRYYKGGFWYKSYSPEFDEIRYTDTLYRGVKKVKKKGCLKDFSFVEDIRNVHFDIPPKLNEKEQTTINKLIKKIYKKDNY